MSNMPPKPWIATSALVTIALGCGRSVSDSPSGITSTNDAAPYGLIRAECQVATNDPNTSNNYALYVTAESGKKITAKVSAWNDGIESVVAQSEIDEGRAIDGLVSISVSGPQDSKVMYLKGESGYVGHANQLIVLHSIAVDLQQIVHPDDDTRAAGAVFHALKSISIDGKSAFPAGVSLTGSNCFSVDGFNAYGF